jgi:beta-glucosidase
VRNTGERDGDETVEAYLIPKNIVGAPLRVLVGFEKVHLPRGAAKTVRIEISPRQLGLVSSVGNRSVRPGDYDLYVGGGQPCADSGVLLPFHIQGSSPIAP